MSPDDSKRVLITGVSSGIGYGLAKEFLNRGWQVFGVSRRQPEDLAEQPSFQFQRLDLGETQDVEPALRKLLRGIESLDLAVLNAGILGKLSDMSDADLSDLKNTMKVNVWANKVILDALYENDIKLPQVVAISSGASVNGNRGWSGYSISKAALNMLIKLYAQERPETHFCPLAPGIVDTGMQAVIAKRPSDERFPSFDRLRSKRGTAEMPQPADAAGMLIDVFARLPDLVASGEYADVRSLPE